MNTLLSRFIVFEGLDGAGTTTQMKLLAEACDKKDIACHATFEPTGSPIGKLVRSILQKQVVATPLSLAMLYAADREDHLHHPLSGIVHQLDSGKLVISDRYFYSSLAYQSVDCGYERIAHLNQFPAPEYLFYIDTPVAVCLDRISERGGDTELFEHREFLLQVQANYERVFSSLEQPVKFFRLDGTKSRESISKEVLSVLTKNGILN